MNLVAFVRSNIVGFVVVAIFGAMLLALSVAIDRTPAAFQTQAAINQQIHDHSVAAACEEYSPEERALDPSCARVEPASLELEKATMVADASASVVVLVSFGAMAFVVAAILMHSRQEVGK